MSRRGPLITPLDIIDSIDLSSKEKFVLTEEQRKYSENVESVCVLISLIKKSLSHDFETGDFKSVETKLKKLGIYLGTSQKRINTFSLKILIELHNFVPPKQNTLSRGIAWTMGTPILGADNATMLAVACICNDMVGIIAASSLSIRENTVLDKICNREADLVSQAVALSHFMDVYPTTPVQIVMQNILKCRGLDTSRLCILLLPRLLRKKIDLKSIEDVAGKLGVLDEFQKYNGRN